MKYLVRVSGLVEVEAPNAAAALWYARYGKLLKADAVRISAGVAQIVCPQPRGRNVKSIRLGVRHLPSTRKVEWIGPKP